MTHEHLAMPTGPAARTTPVDVATRAGGGAAAGLHLPLVPFPEPSGPTGTLADVERAAIESALEEARFNKSRAARALGLTRGQLYGRLRRLGIDTAD